MNFAYFRWKMSRTEQNDLFSVHRIHKLTLFCSCSQKVLKFRKLAALGILGFLGISRKTILGIGIEFLMFCACFQP